MQIWGRGFGGPGGPVLLWPSYPALHPLPQRSISRAASLQVSQLHTCACSCWCYSFCFFLGIIDHCCLLLPYLPDMSTQPAEGRLRLQGLDIIEVEVPWELGHMQGLIVTRSGYTTSGWTIPAEDWPERQMSSNATRPRASSSTTGSSLKSGIIRLPSCPWHRRQRCHDIHSACHHSVSSKAIDPPQPNCTVTCCSSALICVYLQVCTPQMAQMTTLALQR